jgi:hypothetical protein
MEPALLRECSMSMPVPPPMPVDLTKDLGLFVFGAHGGHRVDRWMEPREIERTFAIPVAEVLALADDPKRQQFGFPPGAYAAGSSRRVWRASQIAGWLGSRQSIAPIIGR